MKVSKDHQSFDDWAEGIRPRLIRLVTPLCRGRHGAEDAVQEALLGLWRNRDRVQDWDAYAARAAWLNALKRRERQRPWVPLEDLEKAPPPALQGGMREGLEPWEMERALARLPAAQQTALRLRYYTGLSFKEIGESLKISLNTAASRCRYGLEALRLAFGQHSDSRAEEAPPHSPGGKRHG